MKYMVLFDDNTEYIVIATNIIDAVNQVINSTGKKYSQVYMVKKV